MSNSEIKTCQNCKAQFIIDAADFAFYEKIHVPPPTWCPECRMVRRQLFRNERAFYRRTCALCGKNMITMYAPEKSYTVYCPDCYYSDRWDPLAYGKDYDFSKNFFEQFQALMAIVPRSALYQNFVENSEYVNWPVYVKNSYLVFGGHHYEDCINASSCFYLTDCVDVDFSKKCELCYDSLQLKRCSKVRMSLYSEDCTDSWFLYGCRNCHNCVGCTNLRNKTYCIFNEQYVKEEYTKRLEELQLCSYQGVQAVLKRFYQEMLRYPRRYAWMRNVVNSVGDDLEQVKNCYHCFSATESEDVRYSFFVPTGVKDSHDIDHVGLGTELAHELLSAFGCNRVAFGNRVYTSHDVYYSDDCHDCEYLFGCIGLRKKGYYILNKKYTREEYAQLIPKIVEQMKTMPYTDTHGRVYRYGEFFPPELSPFAYNETVVQEYFPLTKKQALEKGYRWKDPEERNIKIQISNDKLSDHIKDVSDDIVNQVIGCIHTGTCNEQCTTAFKIISQELAFYRKMNLPLPRLCPNCRHYARLRQRNPLKLWKRSCMCAGGKSEARSTKSETIAEYINTATHRHGQDHCSNEFETSYAPERPEIVYCEACYNAEVV